MQDGVQQRNWCEIAWQIHDANIVGGVQRDLLNLTTSNFVEWVQRDGLNLTPFTC